MHDISNINVIDVETINNCNAYCPLCLRGTGMSTNDKLDWDQVVKNVPTNVWRNVKKINFNGTTGDNLLHPHIEEIVEWAVENTSANISIHTNGSIRSTKWWYNFGTMFKNHKHRSRVVFGIDGLADTHAIYRVGTDFDKIIENATAFIQGGGQADWQFIIFDHNKHQLEECRQLAKEKGFSNFSPIYQDRFDDSGSIGPVKKVSEQYIPVDTIVKTSSNNIKNKFKSFDGSINCKSIETGWISIYADGTIWPCCWLMGWHKAVQQKKYYTTVNYHMKKIIGIDFDTISIYNNSLEDILSSNVWRQGYPNSFKSNPNLVCIQECSK